MPVAVFEDVAEDAEPSSSVKVRAGGTLLSRPAQRLHVPLRAEREKQRVGLVETTTGQGRAPIRANDEVTTEVQEKKARRRTMFVPEDTSMLTIHPGAHTTKRLDDTFAGGSMFDLPYLPGSMERTRQESRTSPEVGRKRVPLGSLGNKCVNAVVGEVVGVGGGKENSPPGGRSGTKKTDEKSAKPVRIVRPIKLASSSPVTTSSPRPTAATASPRSTLLAPTAASQARKTFLARKPGPIPRARVEISQPSAAPKPNPRPSPTPSLPAARPLRSIAADRRAHALSQQYPLLSSHTPFPQLYTPASYLDSEEVALAALVNTIFASRLSRPCRMSREDLLKVYHQPHVTSLHARLRASLECGALAHANVPDVPADLGLRRRFLKLWLDSYEEDVLITAVEVVIGRQIGSTTHTEHDGDMLLEASARILDPAKQRRALVAFLETFLIHVADDAGDGVPPETRWRAMVLRSLMLVWLLDRTLSRRLFKPTSAHKSSSGILHALAALVLPSTGSLMRTLGYLDFGVNYIQDPLDEVSYRVSNLAVDLRDGVILARLVELLGLTKQPLSSALRIPCRARALKEWNVQLTLNTLSPPVEGISAEDIVDGHREKTLELLCAILHRAGVLDDDDATALAWANTHNAHAANLTTAFANGRAYTAILASGAYLLPLPSSAAREEDWQAALACDGAFTRQLFATEGEAIPTTRTTVAMLAVLRLGFEGLEKRWKFVVALQRGFRERRGRAVREEWAVRVLQERWREMMMMRRHAESRLFG